MEEESLTNFKPRKKSNDLDEKKLKKLRRREVDPIVYSKNDMIQRHHQIQSKILDKQLQISLLKDKKDQQLFRSRLNKLKSFKKLQYETELREQVEYMRSLMESRLKVKNQPPANPLLVASIKSPQQTSESNRKVQAESSKAFEDMRSKLKSKLVDRFKLPKLVDVEQLKSQLANSMALEEEANKAAAAAEAEAEAVQAAKAAKAAKYFDDDDDDDETSRLYTARNSIFDGTEVINVDTFRDLDTEEVKEIEQKLDKRLTLLISSSSNKYAMIRFNPRNDFTHAKPRFIQAPSIDVQALENKESLAANYELEKLRKFEQDKKVKNFLMDFKKLRQKSLKNQNLYE